jgi:hypothetical protein
MEKKELEKKYKDLKVALANGVEFQGKSLTYEEVALLPPVEFDEFMRTECRVRDLIPIAQVLDEMYPSPVPALPFSIMCTMKAKLEGHELDEKISVVMR